MLHLKDDIASHNDYFMLLSRKADYIGIALAASVSLVNQLNAKVTCTKVTEIYQFSEVNSPLSDHDGEVGILSLPHNVSVLV